MQSSARMWSGFAFTLAGARSSSEPFHSLWNREEIGKATESQHSREINFKLP